VLFATSAAANAKPATSKLVVTEPILEVLDRTGSVTVASVQQGIAKIERDIAQCGDDAKWVGDALVWMITDWHGKVMRLEVAVEKSAVEKCLGVVLKRIVVPKAQSRATTMMRLRVAPPAKPDGAGDDDTLK
jgi:hypothetical protein